ncbi:ankyrin repeat-containing protein [Anaeramoeba flamelloides]|uniref:Ankyrin repeat-containing protein n=1 Tax=Anaeramoeba flamelloides TaxID=1746091 RepID=A0ABQ8XKP3_9EUKA|nr:ankyrin repeat-containing protein [Anaeramoeba flamelloides]
MLIGKCFPLDLIKYAIEKGGKLVDTNEKNAFHPVIFSCHNHKDLKYLKYLISIGADLNVKNSLKVSFLEKLCQTHKPNLQMIEYLLENNADINYYCISRGSKPPLFMLSIHETPIELIQKFISKGAKITFEIRNLSITLLENICQKDNVSIQLLNYCYSLFKNHKSLELILQKSAFNLVQHKDNINALKELIKLGFNPHSKNGRNFNLLYSHLLGNSHNLDFIKFLVEEIKIPINDYCDQTYEKTSLEMAVIRRLPIETIIYLLSKGGDPNVKMSNEYYFGTNEDKNQIFLSEKILRWYFSYRFNDVLTKSNSENALIDIYTRLFDALIDSGFNINKPSTENYKHFLSYCGYIIGTKKSKGIFEHILDRGLNPWTIIDKGKNLFANECFSYKRSKKKAANYFSMVLDFYELFKRKENTDFIITSNEDEKIPCHSLILKMRLVNDKIDLERICNVLQNEKKSQIVDFLYWVYCGYVPRPDEDVEKLNLNLALKIGFTKELFYQKNGRNGLLKDLKQFYQNKKSMDFIITVHIENDDDEDSNDEKEIEKEIENENRVTQEKVEEEKIVEIPVHKLILQARSELYRGLFYNLSEQKKVSDYTGKSPLAIQILIEYFYTESVSKEFDEDTLLELFDAVEYYQLSESSSLHYHINKANEYQNQKMRNLKFKNN